MEEKLDTISEPKTIHGEYKEDSMKIKNSKWDEEDMGEGEQEKENSEKCEKQDFKEDVSQEENKDPMTPGRTAKGLQTFLHVRGDADLENKDLVERVNVSGDADSDTSGVFGNRRGQSESLPHANPHLGKEDVRSDKRDANAMKTYAKSQRTRHEIVNVRRTYSEGSQSPQTSLKRRSGGRGDERSKGHDFNTDSRPFFHSRGSLGEEEEEDEEGGEAYKDEGEKRCVENVQSDHEVDEDDDVDTSEISDAIKEFRRIRHKQICQQLERQQHLQQQQQQQQQQHQRNLDRSSSHGILSRQPPHNRGIKKCKSATFSLDGMQYTIGEYIHLSF
ncbi:hypothetical protein ElyMa_001885800 [Elysia marginata]|uniref:Uncharacterized protein n=1 Tax=Elysia marginata TaxID=1093978 RepID=A0AAV4ER14_9GAST|nr:hypothetical protein ElyMa_001885800 [Elysia marginata]